MSHVQKQQRRSVPTQKSKGLFNTDTRQGRSRIKALSVVTGLIGFLLFCATPFLPVNQVQSSFSWPQGGNLNSVTAPLVSYSPENISVTLPLSEVKDLNPGKTTVLSTVPTDSKQSTLRGMFVRSTNDGLDVVVRNVVPLSVNKSELAKLPDNAVLRITSDYQGTRVWIPDAKRADGTPMDGSIGGDNRPMLTGIYSELVDSPENTQKAQDAGLQVNVKVDSRYTSSPSMVKYAAMWVGGLLTLISLWALHRIDMLDGRPGRGRMLAKGWWKPRWIDAAVGFVLLVWYIIGANTADDGYLLTMAKASHDSGYMANYYRWFGVPESPFGAPYYDLLGLMVNVTAASTWMRLPGLIAGLVTWLILSREVLPRLGVKINNRQVAHWTTAAMFVLFWMVYNNGTRPEPVIAVFAILTWVSFERAIATRRLLPAAVGTILAALALGAGPTGLIAVAAMLASLGVLIRIVIRRLPALDAPKGSSKLAIAPAVLAQIAPFLAAGTAILTAVFGDQTLRTVSEAIAVRSDRGPAMSWYEEYYRYTALLEQTADGSFARRFTVLMMFFCFGVVIASMLHNRGRVPGAAKGPSTRLVLVILGTMFFMTFTPTKWTHHFGVYAGIGGALAGLAAVAASHMALRSRRNRVLFTGATLLLFAFTLSGTNGWWYISSFGVPWWDKTIQFAGIEASTVMLVLSLLVLVWGVVIGFLSDAKTARAETSQELEDINRAERKRTKRFAGVAAAPIGVITAFVVVFSLASMGKGMLSQWPAYSVGKGNLMSLAGKTCELASDVRVERDTNDSFLQAADGSGLKDSLVAPDSRGFEPNNIPTRINPRTGGNQSSSSMPQTSVSNQQFVSADDPTGGGTGNTGNSGSNTNGTKTDNAAKPKNEPTGSNELGDSGNTGGLLSEPGINGSYALLPFGLDSAKVPVVGSFTEGLQRPAQTTTKWFTLPERSADRPLIVFSAAGEVAHFDMNGVFQYGQELRVEFGRKGGNGKFEKIGEFLPLDIGTAPEWRNMRIPMDKVPPEATAIRIAAVDMNLTPDQWMAFTPPRAPKLQSMNDYLGSKDPGLIDWSAAFQFPCQRPYSHWAGVAEVPQFRISPDHSGRWIHTSVMDYYGGGSVGMTEMLARATEIPTYLQDDWQRDWGVLDRLRTYRNGAGEEPKQVQLQEETITRSGLWYNGPMKYNGN
ncbi:arabinosyltransferase domain-containing protein [Corynebacterium heidelbergense]|uniref:arabinosyltransferase domain-containing protein n=1 Tax=Corynebacterium heidelbergense TaxID=2055947 RepID=UPI0026B9FBD5